MGTVLFASFLDALLFILIGSAVAFIYLRIVKKSFRAMPYIITTIIAVTTNIILLYGGSKDRDEYSALGITIRVLSTIVAIIIFSIIGLRKKKTP